MVYPKHECFEVVYTSEDGSEEFELACRVCWQKNYLPHPNNVWTIGTVPREFKTEICDYCGDRLFPVVWNQGVKFTIGDQLKAKGQDYFPDLNIVKSPS